MTHGQTHKKNEDFKLVIQCSEDSVINS